MTEIRISLQYYSGKYPISLELTGPRNHLLQVPGMYVNPYDYKNPNYGRLPLTPLALDKAKEILPNLTIDRTVLDWYDKELLLRELLVRSIKNPTVHDKLYTHQNQGLEFLEFSRRIPQNRNGIRVLLADDPRLGKTIQAIKSLVYVNNSPILILCLKSLIEYWVEELHKWGDPGLTIKPLTDKLNVNQRAAIVRDDIKSKQPVVWVTNWEFIREVYTRKIISPRILAKINTFIGDEAHVLRNIKSQLFTSVSRLKPKNMLLLTATPNEHGVQDFFGYLKLLRSMEFKSYWQWVGTFCNLEQGHFGVKVLGSKNIDLLKDFLTPIVLRRSAEHIMNLPDKIYKVIPVKTTDKYTKTYNTIANDILIQVQDDYEELEIPNALARLTRLRQYSAYPKLLGFNYPAPKAQVLSDLCKNKFANYQVVVYCAFRDALMYLQRHLTDEQISCTVYRGKDTTIKLFKQKRFQVLLTTAEMGGVGLDFSNAKVLVYYDLPLSSTVLRQSVERTTAIGVKSTRLIISLAATPIDRAIADLLENKQRELTDSDIVLNVKKFH